ncbi:ATP-binding cassette domain-containing protein [Mycoplasmopsis glycophila]|uniref:Alkylphosphonate ABC transporter, ATP-binding component n=1 Tax=Mycoplasmopsis glycophila TaxID=171285 RepID=A0A449AWD4_9BACT|nr:ABC transporter ATP-binding protein [Mycoplasmopsis glycophila]VEU71023.1 Alkylphosphonate ABC transporter, ATP-binding component [Mycoplasmopsis glycophila]
MLKFKNVTISYHKNYLKDSVFDDVSFYLKEGEIIGIIGKSGYGKSTILKSIFDNSLIKEGELIYNNTDILSSSRKTRKKFKKSISFIDQDNLILEDYDFYHNVLFSYDRYQNWFFKKIKYLTARELDLLWDILKKLNLEDFAFIPLTKLSSGQKQRLNIARALFNDGQIILADEPTSNLDFNNSELVMQLFKEEAKKNKLVLIAIHDLDLALKYCDKLVALKNHEIYKFIDKKDFNLAEIKEYFD